MSVSRGFGPLTDDGAGLAADWGRRTRRITVAPAFLGTLRRITVDRLLDEESLRPPLVSFARDGRQIPDREVTSGEGPPEGPAGPLDRTKARALVAGGATVMVYRAHQLVEPLGEVAGHISSSLRASCGTTVFHTPARHPGLGWHRDGEHVVAVQISGSKEWQVEREAPAYWWTTGALPSGGPGAAGGPDTPVDRIVLRTGEALYLPPGAAHTARATGRASTHVSFVVREPGTRDLVVALFERAARGVRTGLDRGPVGGRRERAAEVARELSAALGGLDVEELLRLVEEELMETGAPPGG
ncbi:JmjC domain-containing protein [Streptomyces sp. NPDC003691]